MYSTFDRLRLSASLAHHVPSVKVALHRHRRAPLVVGFGPDADVDPCTIRQMLLARGGPTQGTGTALATKIEMWGCSTTAAGDVVRVRQDDQDQRWFATLLAPSLIHQLLQDLECEPQGGGVVSATLKPDPGLGVTSVCIAVVHPMTEAAVDELAMAAYSTCVVHELIHAPQPNRPPRAQPPNPADRD